MKRTSLIIVALVLGAAVASLQAHVTPVVVLRKQADVIRAALPNAAGYFVTTVRIGRAQLTDIVNRGHFEPDRDSVKFFSGKAADGTVLGTVVFSQVDTQHGPIEAGVAIGPDGAVTSVMVTRATVEVKPWILDVERSGALDRLKGVRADDAPKKLSDAGTLRGMTGYVADAIATATYRAVVLDATLRST